MAGDFHGVGKTSVADLILQRTRLLQAGSKPSIQVAKTEPLPIPESNEEIISSLRHKEMITAEAIENRDYYLLRQLENEGIPWFRYVRKQSQYSEFVMMSSDMAKELLDSIWTEEEGNRKIKVQIKDSYKRDIQNGRWIPSDESIGIDFNGKVYNGRHRLTALFESGKECIFYITFNALEEAKFTVDSGVKRNSSEKLRLVIATKLGNRTTGFCKALMKGLNGKQRYTETEVAEFAHKWQELIDWISVHLPTARAEVQAAIAKAYLWYGPEQMEHFCERLREVKFGDDGDPAKTLFLVLQRFKTSRAHQPLVAYKKTLASVDAAVKGKTLSKLYEREDDIFQWQEGWELPNGSWWGKNKN